MINNTVGATRLRTLVDKSSLIETCEMNSAKMTVFLHRGKFDLLALIGINGHFLKTGVILTLFNNSYIIGVSQYNLFTSDTIPILQP